MKKLLALFMSVVMVVSLSVISIAQVRPEVTPVQERGRPNQDTPVSTGEESADSESDITEETSSMPESESDSPPEINPAELRRQKIAEITANLPDGIAKRITDRTMAADEKREIFEDRKDQIIQRREEAFQKRQEFENKREEFAHFRNQLKEYRAQAISNMQENNMLRAEISKLRGELKDSLLALDAQEIKLSEDVLSAVKAYTEQIHLIAEDLKSTKGSIGDALSQAAKSRADLDYEGMVFLFEELYEIQAYRNECMEAIIENLRSILQLLISEA